MVEIAKWAQCAGTRLPKCSHALGVVAPLAYPVPPPMGPTIGKYFGRWTTSSSSFHIFPHLLFNFSYFAITYVMFFLFFIFFLFSSPEKPAFKFCFSRICWPETGQIGKIGQIITYVMAKQEKMKKLLG